MDKLINLNTYPVSENLKALLKYIYLNQILWEIQREPV